MSISSGNPNWIAFTILLILACGLAGCTSYQSPAPSSATATTTTSQTPDPAAGGNTVIIKNFAFSPAMLTVPAGTTVTWINQDEAQHAVVSDDDSVAPVSFMTAPLSQGGSAPVTFDEPGTYTYHCSIHPTMKGTIVVTS